MAHHYDYSQSTAGVDVTLSALLSNANGTSIFATALTDFFWSALEEHTFSAFFATNPGTAAVSLTYRAEGEVTNNLDPVTAGDFTFAPGYTTNTGSATFLEGYYGDGTSGTLLTFSNHASFTMPLLANLSGVYTDFTTAEQALYAAFEANALGALLFQMAALHGTNLASVGPITVVGWDNGNSTNPSHHLVYTADANTTRTVGDLSYDVYSGDGFQSASLSYGGLGQYHQFTGEDFYAGSEVLITLSDHNDTVTAPRGMAADRMTINGGAGNDNISIAPFISEYAPIADELRLNGGSGNDTINVSLSEGTDSQIIMTGGGGSDFITANSTSDPTNSTALINGGRGQDTLWGFDREENTINGGSGHDKIEGGRLADDLNGDEGNDTLTGFAGDDWIVGGAGHDDIRAGDGDDILQGGLGDDTLDGGLGSDLASYEMATQGVSIFLQYGSAQTSDGSDVLTNINGLIGSAQNDRLAGDGLGNELYGAAGNDTLRGKGGNDLLDGGAGDDKLRSENGNDVLYGGAGNDVLVAFDGDDDVFGDAGRDTLFGGGGKDTLAGGADADNIKGNRGTDQLFGGEGADTLTGGGGGDTLRGETGDDALFGEGGSDTVDGGSGNDVLRGGTAGASGDGSADVFVFAAGYQADVVKDFEDGLDRIDLSSFGFGSFAAVEALAQDRATGLRIDLGGGDVLFLAGMTEATFDAGDVILL